MVTIQYNVNQEPLVEICQQAAEVANHIGQQLNKTAQSIAKLFNDNESQVTVEFDEKPLVSAIDNAVVTFDRIGKEALIELRKTARSVRRSVNQDLVILDSQISTVMTLGLFFLLGKVITLSALTLITLHNRSAADWNAQYLNRTCT